MKELNKDKAVALLNRILEHELAGVVRYTHYSLLVFGFNRIPIVACLREQAAESLTHAQQAGEMITPSRSARCWIPTGPISARSCGSRSPPRPRRSPSTRSCSPWWREAR